MSQLNDTGVYNYGLNPCRLCHERALFSDTLDAIKFVCKELWVACWDKQVDNLRTNHRVSSYLLVVRISHLPDSCSKGVYVLQDNSFKPIQRISSWYGRNDALNKAKVVRSFYSRGNSELCQLIAGIVCRDVSRNYQRNSC